MGSKAILGFGRVIQGYLGLYRDNGKENGNYYLRFWADQDAGGRLESRTPMYENSQNDGL